MKTRTIFAVAAVFAKASAAAVAMADVPACPAWLGGYVATVDGAAVTVCPTLTASPGVQSTACPHDTGMVRVDVRTGSSKMFLGPCVADPAGGGSGDAGTPCYLDPCVPPGTYEYGYQIPEFTLCNESCAGPTSGEWATVVTVSSSACPADGGVAGPLGVSPALWRYVDAAAVDGAVTWSGTCTGPLPGPDGGYCAWEWLDGSAQWAPCPPDGGTLCPGQEADGAVVPIACPTSTGGGFGSSSLSNGNGGSDDSGATEGPAEAPAAGARGGGGQGEGGGCAVSSGEGGWGAAYAALAALSLAIRIRSQRRKRARAPAPR